MVAASQTENNPIAGIGVFCDLALRQRRLTMMNWYELDVGGIWIVRRMPQSACHWNQLR